MRVLVLLSLIIISSSSCKKDLIRDRLHREASILVGEWGWTHTERKYLPNGSSCNGTQMLTPSDIGASYTYIFEKKGFVSFYKNDSLVYKHSTHIRYFDEALWGADGYDITILLDNDFENQLHLYVAGDKLRIDSFEIIDGCSSETHAYYERLE